MRKFVIFAAKGHPACRHPLRPHEGPDSRELSPVTAAEFELAFQWTGSNDLAFKHFLRHNNFFELDQFNEDALCGADVAITPGEPIIDLNIVYGDDG